MTIARIENGTIVEYRELGIEDVPAHKRSIWKPVVYEGSGPQRSVYQEADCVRIALSAAATHAPRIISDRQFFQQLALLGIITPDEALAAVGPGEIPAAMSAMVDALPSEQQFPARMLLTGATAFDRSHALVPAFAAAFGWTPQQIEDFWIAASAL